MTLPVFLAGVVIFVGLPINWLVVGRLIQLYRRRSLPVLRERAIAATAIALTVTLFAIVFVNNSFFDPRGAPLNAFASMVITRVAILGLAIPALYWLWIYR